MNQATYLRARSVDDLQSGDMLGSYQLLCPIARGGMGQVWAARQVGRLGLPRLVALKTALPLSEAHHETMQQLLLDEARVAASIDHPNVCRIFELNEDRGISFIAMEWIYGGSLLNLLKGVPTGRLDPHLAAYVVAQAAAGLHAAHELSDDDGVPLDVVHRDATPQNILISAQGDVKVVDFGIVKARNQLHQPTQAGEVKGKLSYVAPEQLKGAKVDRRADVYALGCVLYLAATGQRAFRGDDPGTTMLRIIKHQYLKPSAVMPGFPSELEAIIVRAIAHRRQDRFQTAHELRLALQAFSESGGFALTREDVGTVVRRVLGDAIEQRRAEVRAAQKLFDSQGAAAESELGSGSYPIRGRPEVKHDLATSEASASTTTPPFRRSYPTWAVVALVAVIGSVLLGLLLHEPRVTHSPNAMPPLPAEAPQNAPAVSTNALAEVETLPEPTAHASANRDTDANVRASMSANSGAPERTRAPRPAARPRATKPPAPLPRVQEAVEQPLRREELPKASAEAPKAPEAPARPRPRHKIDETDPFE